MPSSATVISLQNATQQVYLYAGFFIFITGIIGESFNILIFTTLKTFRKTSCGFYLTIISIANFGQIITTVLIRTVNYGLSTNLLQLPWICKIREFLVHYFALIAFTSICLATIDEFLSLIRPQWSSLRLAHRHVAIICLIWFGHNIPLLIYSDVLSGSCTIVNITFDDYVNYFVWPVFLGCLPIFIMIIFSILAFYHVRILHRNETNVIRFSQDRQLTGMVLVYVVFIVILSVPCIIYSIYTINLVYIDAEQNARSRLIYTILSMFYYEIYACSFYIYCCVSKRFRKQLVYVLIDIHLKRWRNRVHQIRHNQIGLFVENITNDGSKAGGTAEIALY